MAFIYDSTSGFLEKTILFVQKGQKCGQASFQRVSLLYVKR